MKYDRSMSTKKLLIDFHLVRAILKLRIQSLLYIQFISAINGNVDCRVINIEIKQHYI